MKKTTLYDNIKQKIIASGCNKMDEKEENIKKETTEKTNINESMKDKITDETKKEDKIPVESLKEKKADEKAQKEEKVEKNGGKQEHKKKIEEQETPKYVPYTPITNKKKEKKDKFKVVERPDIEKEFNRLKRKRKKQIVITLMIVILILAIGIFCTGFALMNLNSDKILSGISIRNIDVGGLNKEQAIEALNKTLEFEKTREVKLTADGETTTMTLEQIEMEYLVEEAVNKAYEIGRNGNIFQNNFTIMKSMKDKQNIDLEVKYNEQLLDDTIKSINSKLPNSMIDNTYNIEEEELVITRGTAGLALDIEKNKEIIIDLAKKGELTELKLETVHKECPEIDIQKIYEEVYTEPQDAYYTTDPFQIYPHKNGIDFDVAEAKKEIEKEKKDEYVIKLKITEPKVLTNQIGTEAFPDLLSTFSTKYDSTNISRSTNIAIASSKIDGTVVMPGEVFSYNKTVGKRTVEAGYKEAAGFSGGRVVPMLGGGICQVSSTLYDAIVYANLGIVERHNHMFQVAYVDTGKDATVVYGSLDFKFENTRKYPIMLKASAKSGQLRIQVYGVKEEVEYDVEIVTKVLNYTPYKVIYETDSSLGAGQERVEQAGIRGCKSITYKILKLNGAEVSQTVLSSDSYDPQNKIIRRGPTSSTSTAPETPTTPEKPTEPTTPVQPETPETPTTPTTPTEPETPEVPTTPENTTKPTTPEPTTQTNPTTPVEPAA